MSEAATIHPHVVYPFGPLVDLIAYKSRAWRLYGIEFTGGLVKVGRSRNIPSRFQTLTKNALDLGGYRPTRFFISPIYSNAGTVENAVLDALRLSYSTAVTPDDFPASSEWFMDLDLDVPCALAAEWKSVPNQYGHPFALRQVDIAAKGAAEAATTTSAAVAS